MPRYKVISPIRHAGRHRKVGDTVTLDADDVTGPLKSCLKLLPDTSAKPEFQEGHLAGVLLADGTFMPLKKLSDAELRELAAEMDIADSETLPLPELVVALAAVPVQVPTGDQGGAGGVDQVQAQAAENGAGASKSAPASDETPAPDVAAAAKG